MDILEENKKITKKMKSWKTNTLDPVLTKFPEKSNDYRTSSDIPKDRLYTPIMIIWKGKGFPESIHSPGVFSRLCIGASSGL